MKKAMLEGMAAAALPCAAAADAYTEKVIWTNRGLKFPMRAQLKPLPRGLGAQKQSDVHIAGATRSQVFPKSRRYHLLQIRLLRKFRLKTEPRFIRWNVQARRSIPYNESDKPWGNRSDCKGDIAMMKTMRKSKDVGIYGLEGSTLPESS